MAIVQLSAKPIDSVFVQLLLRNSFKYFVEHSSQPLSIKGIVFYAKMKKERLRGRIALLVDGRVFTDNMRLSYFLSIIRFAKSAERERALVRGSYSQKVIDTMLLISVCSHSIRVSSLSASIESLM